jgi:hypothetical protein
MDDILIFSSGIREDYFRKVRLVLRKLWDVDLYLDTEKSKFAKKTIKYLDFIVHADGKGLEADPEKVVVI